MNHRHAADSRILALVAGVAIGLVGCYGPSKTVRRAHPDEQIDLSGGWNDTDANQVAAVMIHDCLLLPWAARFQTETGRRPVVRLYPIRNRTSDHMDTRFFTKQVEQELIRSGMIDIVADLTEARDNRYERWDQANHASAATMKPGHNETGSDYVLNGWVVEQNDGAEDREVRAYVATMELVDTTTNVKVWMKAHRIKKEITRADVVW